MDIFQPWHLILVALVAVIFFGGKRLPELGKGLGEGFKGFKDGLKGVTEETTKPGETAHTVTPQTAAKTEDTVTK